MNTSDRKMIQAYGRRLSTKAFGGEHDLGDVFAAEKEGRTMLLHAARRGDEALNVLINSGANIDHQVTTYYSRLTSHHLLLTTIRRGSLYCAV